MGKAVLADAVNKTPITVERWIKKRRFPSAQDARKIALACGCEPEEATQLASECFPLEAKRTA